MGPKITGNVQSQLKLSGLTLTLHSYGVIVGFTCDVSKKMDKVMFQVSLRKLQDRGIVLLLIRTRLCDECASTNKRLTVCEILRGAMVLVIRS